MDDYKNNGVFENRNIEFIASKNSESIVNGIPKGSDNISNIFSVQNDVPGIFVQEIQQNNIIDVPTASSDYDSLTNLMGETNGNVTEIPAITGAVIAKGKRSRNSSSSSLNSPNVQCDSFSFDDNMADEIHSTRNEANSENLMFEENDWCVWSADEGEYKNASMEMLSSTMDAPQSNSIIKTYTKRRPIQRNDYSYKTRRRSAEHVELSTSETEKEWLESNKTKLQFLHGQFLEVLPRIFYDIVRKRIKDPVHYIVLHLMKYKVDKSMNVKTRNYFYERQ